MATLGPFLISASLTALLAYGLLRWAPRWGLVDEPTPRKAHPRSVPIGGPALVLGVLAGSVPFLLTSGWGGSWAVGALLVALLGTLDDRRRSGLSPRIKLLGQLGAALLPLAFGPLLVASLDVFGWEVPLGALAIPFTLLWIVGITNAINLIDGLDGLACGQALIAALALAGLSVQTGNEAALTLSFALLGGTFAFLAFNRPPAKLFLGDGGSYFLGFTLAVLSLQATLPTHGGGVALLVPAALLGYPIADTLWAILRRLRAGRSIFRADTEHFHHRVRDAMRDERRSVWAFYGLFLLLAALATALRTSGP